MKILLCTDRYYPAISGVVTSVMTLKKYLEAAGHETRILTLSDTIASHVSGDIVYIGSFDAEKIYPDVRIKHPVNKAYLDSLIQWSPDIIHCRHSFWQSTYTGRAAVRWFSPIIRIMKTMSIMSH